MIRQCAIIFGCLFAGELLVYLTGIKIPSSIIGMLLLTALLYFKVVKLRHVKAMSDLFIQNLAFFFIPPGVAIMLYFDVIRSQFLAIALSSVVSTLLVLTVTGWVYQKMKKNDD
ncbi:MAG: CidA/LrgA family protein [Bacteroidota bacterium]|nr:CidA/LrgA family protein [Bacteroidota bacterium]